ncbi:MAG TPA: methylenetetrahydrofolate reductase [Dehalococcoidia bacterium]|nr:methylenetetrahydrofolate reductase [Dehalococcoidia bacterium]
MSKLKDALNSGKFVVTAEVAPPKGVDVAEMLGNAELLRSRVDALNVTDQQSSVMRLGSLASCHLLIDRGIETIFQMTTRDRNRIALQSDLLSAYVMGVENVLCLTGDYVTLGDHPHAKAVFDLDSVGLLRAARSLEQGRDMSDKELKGVPKFFLGAVVTPGANPLEPQLFKMEKKVLSGAQFFQTQAVYEPAKFESFMKYAEQFKVPVLVGIIPLKSVGMARFMNKNVAGVHVPEDLIEELGKAEDKYKKTLEITARLINQMKPMCQGVHLMAIGWEKKVPEILDAAGL